MFRKILCPIDFSPESKHALRVAARLASADHAELVVTHVCYQPVATASASRLQSELENARDELDAAVKLATENTAPVSSRLLTGVPWHQIVETAEADPFDLIVLGTRGRSGLSRFLLGSVAETVVRHSPISVLVVRGEGEGPRFRHVLCPIDFSDGSARVVERAVELADPTGVGLVLFHSIELPIAHPNDPEMTDFVVGIDRRASDELERYTTASKDRTRARITTDVQTGSPAAQVLGAIDADPTFDLVVVGSYGRTGIRRVLLGSVAEKLLRHAPCSVLVVR